MKRWLTVFAGLALTISIACRPQADATAQARHEFRERIAALNVASAGSTYAEFRERRLAVETCYAANQSLLPAQQSDFTGLSFLLAACDTCWRKSQLSIAAGDTHFLYTPEERNALVIINPAVSNKLNLPVARRFSDPDFDATYNTKLALTEIHLLTSRILAGLTD